METFRFFLQRRLQPTHQLDFKKIISEQYRVVIFSALLGAASHIFWDGFTHNGSFFVTYFEVYRHVVVPFQGVKYPLFYALQHISTFAGLNIIVIYIYFMPMDVLSPVSRPSISYWLLLVLVGFVFFTLRFAFFPQDFDLGNAVVTGISSILLSLCILGSIKKFNPIKY